MLSNYAQATNVRLNGVDPAKEQAVVPLLAIRIKDAAHKNTILEKGEVLLSEVLALQPAHFGRVYAAYGGVFIVISILWGWKIDNIAPVAYDITGGIMALVGVGIIMYWPRPN
ncbi:YnfA family protein [Desulfococcus multivorans]|jgi:drug/metabolite transporter superfamily protein YnfA|uniref:Uncharacterized protein n=1 Tax=Desulfococcus multivorans DSM 2059 TaxID=1121405 RepID=S7T075_DESML|nr:YnfA family protein [Desulfococcus multivorans]AOY57293.1 putative membrane protein, UPF0060 [Desulfococcus multivorans]AQX36451.1 hypothetical protein B2D07_19850 [Desulfococcus multivorans]EPR30482.1 protein of unknown function UPF0060 [Desulfococcus multivorans DSM 2059]MDX9819345.1 YnfA family protein [Desulfococcus multivorans]SKA21577.1 Uncharacterised BCR, YnfA/UPF0060 family [Desulfococcus multivorans DSM 2059]